MIKVSLLGFTTEIKNKIDQLNLPQGDQRNKKKILEENNSYCNYWRINEEGS